MPKLATLKIQQARNEPILANPEIQHFSRIKFSKNMFIFKAKEYQSEKSPIFDSQKSTKTTRKLHIMSQLYAAKVCQLFCNTRQNRDIEIWWGAEVQGGIEFPISMFGTHTLLRVDKYQVSIQHPRTSQPAHAHFMQICSSHISQLSQSQPSTAQLGT